MPSLMELAGNVPVFGTRRAGKDRFESSLTFNRQFDPEPGGGPVDPLFGAETTASIPRQFDDKKGGGFMDKIRQAGPDWLDEGTTLIVAIVGLGLLVQLFGPAFQAVGGSEG